MPQNIRDVRCVRREDECRRRMSTSHDRGGRQVDRDADRPRDRNAGPSRGEKPDHVKVRDVASKQRITLCLRQDLDEALRMIAQCRVRSS
jgi:hypothetical protein